MKRILAAMALPLLLLVLALALPVGNLQRIKAQDHLVPPTAVLVAASEPDNDPAHATAIACGGSGSGVIDPVGDVDYYRFDGSAGQLIVADIEAWVNGSPLDSMLTLFDSDGTTVLDENDDFAWGTYDSHLEHSLPHDGSYYLRVQDWSLDGWPNYSYALSLLCNGPRDIAVTPSSLSVGLSPGQSQTATLTIANIGQGTLSFGVREEDTRSASPSLTSHTNTVRILSWVRFTGINPTDVEYGHALEAIEQYFDNFTVAESNTQDPAALAAALVDKDVLLLPEPHQATSADLEAAGSTLQSTLQAFVRSGHIVVATSEWLDWQGFLRTAALLDAQYSSGCQSGCAWTMPVVDPAHPLAIGLGATIQGANSTTSYVIGNSDVQVVVASPDGDPVVATRDIGIGHVVLIGYDYYSYNGDAARVIANAVQWAQTREDVSWLAALPNAGALSGPQSQDVRVTFDAAGLTTGTYPANLLIFDDDPNEILVTVPVTLTVSPVLPGDVDGDCDVDIVDIMLVAGRWNSAPGHPRYDPRYDVDGDGDIDVVDIMLVAAHWGETCSGAALRSPPPVRSMRFAFVPSATPLWFSWPAYPPS
jgi:hypothetical protein